MRILVTGGAGYIGTHICLKLMEEGHEVVVLDNFCNSHREMLTRVEAQAGKPLKCIEGDIRDAEVLGELFALSRIEAVIHCAALKAVGESVEKPLEYYDNNVVGTVALLKAMQEAGVKTLVFSSSSTVYGNPASLPVKEGAVLEATNPYGHGKLMVETLLEGLCQADATWRVALLRCFNPVGAHESGAIGEKPRGAPGNLMPYIARVATGELEKLRIFGDDYPTLDGTAVRDYIHIMDLAEGHISALEYVRMRGGLLKLNLGSGKGHSVLELVRMFEEVSGRPVPFETVARRAGDIAACWADTGAAQETLGWKATRGLKEMCTDAWKWQASQK